jgi:glucan 1,3-beta-glucosidase
MYGLVNEPRMIELQVDRVLKWTEEAYTVVRDKGYNGKIIFGDGFRGLSTWKGAFSGLDGMLLDVHQYVIFNTQQISLTHSGKIEFACKNWGPQIIASMDKTTGCVIFSLRCSKLLLTALNRFGPTIVGEWGQADTDCTEYLNNVCVTVI